MSGSAPATGSGPLPGTVLVLVSDRVRDVELERLAGAEARRRGTTLTLLSPHPSTAAGPGGDSTPDGAPSPVEVTVRAGGMAASVVRVGRPSRVRNLVRASRDGALLVLAARDGDRTWLRLALRARCPLLLVPPGSRLEPRPSVLVALTEQSPQVALLAAWQQCRSRSRSLLALQTWEVPFSQTMAGGYVPPDSTEVAAVRAAALARLADLVADHANDFPEVPVELRVVRGALTPALLHAAATAELIVLARSPFARLGRGRALLRTLVSSVDCPLLLCPAWSTTALPTAPGRAHEMLP